MAPLFLSLDEILEIHAQQIEFYGGSAGLRDVKALESAIATPQATFGGEFFAPFYCWNGCRLSVSSLSESSFIDGNKRTGANAAITFLLMNDYEPLFEVDEFADLVLGVASGQTGKAELTEIFEGRCRAIEA